MGKRWLPLVQLMKGGQDFLRLVKSFFIHQSTQYYYYKRSDSRKSRIFFLIEKIKYRFLLTSYMHTKPRICHRIFFLFFFFSPIQSTYLTLPWVLSTQVRPGSLFVRIPRANIRIGLPYCYEIIIIIKITIINIILKEACLPLLEQYIFIPSRFFLLLSSQIINHFNIWRLFLLIRKDY